ncbi:MAG: pilus assembly protein [Chloroflexota bacterium]|jgi:hypothetical protein
MMLRNGGSRRNRERGQALVELAVVLPVFALVVFGAFDVGRAVYTNSVLSQAAREGARLGATEAGWVGVPDPGCVSEAGAITASNPGAHVCPATAADLKAHIVEAADRMTVGVGSVDVYISCHEGAPDDPPPTGAWTDADDDVGNACSTVGTAGDVVSVRVAHDYQPMTPVIGSLIGSLSLSGSATMIIN